MSMYAVVTDPGLNNTDGYVIVPAGQRIEVLGFVNFARETWAVYRDDEGSLYHIPMTSIRMDPATVKVEA